MKHLIYASTPQPDYPICILTNHISADEIAKAYLHPYQVEISAVLILGLHQKVGAKKTPVKEIKEFIKSELIDVLNENGVQYVVCTDAGYFKQLSGVTKTDPYLGYVLDSRYGSWKIVYAPSHRTIFHSPEPTKAKIASAMEAIKAHAAGTYQEPGSQMLQNVYFPKSYIEIQNALQELLVMDVPLAIDIEAFSLKHYSAGIGSICFAINEHDGVAFAVDYQPLPEPTKDGFYGQQVRNEPVRQLLKQFFQRFSNKSLYHNISYDATVLIYQLFMDNILDSEELHSGMETMLRNWDCTKLITYLATNSCAGNDLGLKTQAQEHAGNYAVDEVKDIRKIPLDKLLRYNLADGCSTWFTYNKNYPVMVADDQEKVYQNPFRPALLDIIQMQLTGMPVNMETVKKAKAKLQADNDDAVARITASPFVQEYQHQRKEDWVEEKNSTYKKKRVTLADADAEMLKEKSDVRWNPNSNLQIQDVLYKLIGLPAIEFTDSGAPATDGDTLKALKTHTTDQRVIDLLDALLDYAAVSKILTSFIPALENAQQGPDGWHYLFGNFNLGGTVSGRLSSNNPNLQNLPATGSKYAKTIKECFEAPPGWLLVGLDFASLEDRISALTTKDPNKLKVYTDGYDGHCLRAYAYFPESMPDIDPNSVESINSIQTKYKSLRQDSKAPTFALTYKGTWKTLVKNCGFPVDVAKKVENRFNELYSVSVQWVQDKLQQAMKDGYVTGALGLRVRTPLLKQVLLGTKKTPAAAEAEGRTAANALGQSWCMLNNRAGSEFMAKVRESKFKHSIKPCAQIHDAQYYLIKEDMEALLFTNEHLVQAVNWNDHPDIYHPEVGLGGDVSIFFPTWANEIVIPNGADEETVMAKISEAMK